MATINTNEKSSLLQTIKKLSALIGRESRRTFLMLIPAILFSSALEMVGLGILPLFIGSIISPEMLGEVPLVGSTIASAVEGMSTNTLVIWGGGLIVVFFTFKAGYTITLQHFQLRFCKQCHFDIGARLFKSYLNIPLDYLLQLNSSQLIRNLNVDVGLISNEVILSLTRLITAGVTVAFILFSLIVIEPAASVALLSFLGVFGIFYIKGFGGRTLHLGQVLVDSRKRMVESIQESIRSAKETRVSGLQQLHAEVFGDALRTTIRCQRIQQWINAINTPLLELMAVYGAMGILVFLLWWSDGDLTAAIPFLSFLALSLVRIRSYTGVVLQSWNMLNFRQSSVDHIYTEILSAERSMKTEDGRTEDFVFEEGIHLERVTYTHPQAKVPSVVEANYFIPKGSCVAFVGPTGSGKTTMVDLILGLRRPEVGAIRFDDQDLAQMKPFQGKVGYVPQEIMLFDTSVRNNVALGCEQSPEIDQRVWEALQVADAADFVRAKPDGLDTFVGENGALLSGGQRQRIGIARAVFTNPEILVLDEGTSALDRNTEVKILTNISSLRSSMTTLMISHHLDSLVGVDLVVSMDAGRANLSKHV
ncbi:ABC transporter ATP-binding protein [Coraliomargarita algicola]|uniref:ABC transporter ATP-binding protein n=1 Tax=Coraliomargarita algicola TaxID=3092156 RepID=A0ABZ0RFQ2_9BACT|nr:ABC transporter ATP-binding protein [Coraliomargarita sp. J2-16]WPJ94995.1 ABC transporter ATP-binding protein [Coraliomargarita sp. J2-16]